MMLRPLQPKLGVTTASVNTPAGMTVAKALANLKTNPNAKLTIIDTAENITKNFDSLSVNKQNIKISPFLGSNSKLQLSYQQYSSISKDDSFLPSSYEVAITAATGQESLSLLTDKRVIELNISDSSQKFIDAARALRNTDRTLFLQKVNEIKFTDDQKNVNLQVADLNLKPILDAKLRGSSVIGTGSIEEINAISRPQRLGAIAVVDTNENISSRFNTIQALKNQIVGISSGERQTILTISAEQAKSSKDLLGAIKNGLELKLTQASARDAAAFARDSRVTSIGVVDTVTNLTRNMSRINSETSKVETVTITDQSQKISKNLETIFKIKNAELKIIQTDLNNPIEISAKALEMNRYSISKSFGENSIKLKDTAENISKTLNSLNSVKNQIKEISVSDNKPIITSFPQIESFVKKFLTPTKIDLTGAVQNLGPRIENLNLNYENATIIRKASSPINIRKPRTIDPIELTANQISSINSPISNASSANSVVVKDTAANVSTNISAISNLSTQIKKISLTDNQSITASYAQLMQLMGKFEENQTYIISDAAANISTNLNAISGLGGKIAQINLTDNLQIAATYAEISPLLGKIATQNSITLTDTAANISSNLSAITAAANTILQVNMTGNTPITATYAEISPLLGKIATQNSVTITDTAANISANLNTIASSANAVSQVNLTGNIPITATYAEISPLLAKIATQNSVTITDTAANISANLDGLAASDTLIANINVVDNNSITADTYSKLVSFDSLSSQSKFTTNQLISISAPKEEIQKIAFNYFANSNNIASKISSLQVTGQSNSELIVDSNFIGSNSSFSQFFSQRASGSGGSFPLGKWNIFVGNISFAEDSTDGDRIVAKFDSGRNDLFYYLNGLDQGQYKLSVDIKNDTAIPFKLEHYGWDTGTQFIAGANSGWTTYTYEFSMQSSATGTVEMNFLSNWFSTDNPQSSEISISKISLTKLP